VVATERIKASAATRMEMEVERNEEGDCKELVRDVTNAVLPTRSELAARAERERGGEHVNLTWRGAARSQNGEIPDAIPEGDADESEGAGNMSLSWKSTASTRKGLVDREPVEHPRPPVSSRRSMHEPASSTSASSEGSSEDEEGKEDEDLQPVKKGPPIGPAGAQLRIGTVVKVTGLTSERASTLNGRTAFIVAYDDEKERFQLKMTDDGQLVNLRRPNFITKAEKLAAMESGMPSQERAASFMSEAAPKIDAWVAFSSAFAAGSEEGVKSALQMRADPNVALSSGELPLAAAAARGMGSCVVTLLAAGVQVDKPNTEGDSALHVAARAGRADMCEMLLGAGARMTRNVAGKTPLEVAAGEAIALLQRSARHSVMSMEDIGDDAAEERSGVGIAPRPLGLPMSDRITAMFGRGEPVDVGELSGTADTISGLRPGAAAVAAPLPLPPMPMPQAQRQPPSIPATVRGDTSTTLLDASQLLHAIALTLGFQRPEFQLKRMLTIPTFQRRRVSCDVLRVGGLGKYKCFLRLGDDPNQRVCIFEAYRARKGKLSNSHYYISLPDDPRFNANAVSSASKGDEKRKSMFRLPIRSSRGDGEETKMPGEDDPVGPGFCGKVRSFGMTGSQFLVYDEGHKPGKEWTTNQPYVRQQLAAASFHRGTSRRAPMSIRVMLPTPEGFVQQEHDVRLVRSTQGDLLKALDAKSVEDVEAPAAMEVHTLAQPEWSEEAQVYQLAYEGRACCMSNKNAQLIPRDRKVAQPVLQVGKLQKNLFNVDFCDFMSPYQAFALALAVFDQSSVRRRI